MRNDSGSGRNEGVEFDSSVVGGCGKPFSGRGKDRFNDLIQREEEEVSWERGKDDGRRTNEFLMRESLEDFSSDEIEQFGARRGIQ